MYAGHPSLVSPVKFSFSLVYASAWIHFYFVKYVESATTQSHSVIENSLWYYRRIHNSLVPVENVNIIEGYKKTNMLWESLIWENIYTDDGL